MHVSCPNCSTAYEIPPPVRPRRLRCARCETEWRVQPPGEAPEPAVVPPAATAPAAPAEQAAPVPDPAPPVAPASPVIADGLRAPVSVGGSNAGLFWLLAWLASLAAIGAGLFAGWHGRVPIEHAWPQALWLFQLLPYGVPV